MFGEEQGSQCGWGRGKERESPVSSKKKQASLVADFRGYGRIQLLERDAKTLDDFEHKSDII